MAGSVWAPLRSDELVMANLKTAGGDRFVQLILGLFANERVEFALSNLIEKGAHLAFITGNLEFYATVRQVAYPTSHIKAFGDLAHSKAESNALNVTFIKYLKRDHACSKLTTEHRLFVRIDETETTFLTLDRIDRYKVLAAVLWSEAGSRFIAFAEILRGYFLSSFVIKADGNFFQRLRRAHRKPILISCIQVHCDEGVVVWLKHSARMSISNLEPVIPKCPRELECVSAGNYFSVCVCP